MYEDIVWLKRQEETIQNLKAERDTYKLLTMLALAGMLAMTVGFLIAIGN